MSGKGPPERSKIQLFLREKTSDGGEGGKDDGAEGSLAVGGKSAGARRVPENVADGENS